MSDATAAYEYDMDNPFVYGNAMGRYKTGRQLSFIRAALSRPGQRILDVGGGSGRLAIPLAAEGHDMTVLDTSAEALEMLAGRTSGAIAGVEGTLMSHVPEAPFDAVLAIDMIKYVTEASMAEIFAKLSTFLAPGGILVVCEINQGSWRNRASELLGRRRNHPYRIETLAGYRAALAETDLEPVREEGLMWMPLSFNSDSRAVPLLARAESSLHLGNFPRQSPWLLLAARKPPSRNPLSPREDRYFLEERYHGEDAGRSRALSAYYAVKPLVPRRLQLAMRRRYAKRQARTEFPCWPIEPLLVERHRKRLLETLEERRDGRLPTIANWPGGRRFAAILTHDVEGPSGVARVPEIIELERRHGLVSSWNFVAEWYPLDTGLLDHVRAAGCEVGLHAIKHDCKLFSSRANFEAELPAIHRYLDEWDAVGFRSPATHRNADWMPELGALYDSSFPDTDPFEPQAGGCCSILPYFLGNLVELPITLVQDHTLWEILREETIDLWTRKSEWIADNGGLINLIVHPDYLDTPARLRMYEEFLEYLAAQPDCWHALPREVAAWWRLRDGLRCVEDERGARVVGEGAERAAIAWASACGEGVTLDPEPQRAET
jgi:SAM-dependent methyltransferase